MPVKKEYKIDIDADAQKVWFVLLDDHHYRKWTSVFKEGSYAKTDNWKEGSIVHFLDPEGNGMYSLITENKPFQKITFTHKGEIKDFKEQPFENSSESWQDATESYTLTEKNGKTTLLVETMMPEEYVEMFDDAFSFGLKIVRDSAENFCISIQAEVKAPIESIWEKWNNPEDIIKWNNASDDWHTTKSENDLTIGGRFKHRMEAKDGSMGFDFEGEYIVIAVNQFIEYDMPDGRVVKISFETEGDTTLITTMFDPESLNSYDLQRDGWQSILNNFKKYVEENQ